MMFDAVAERARSLSAVVRGPANVEVEVEVDADGVVEGGCVAVERTGGGVTAGCALVVGNVEPTGELATGGTMSVQPG